MPHLTEDELVLHYYGELAAADEARAAAHVAGCRECHAELRNLQRVLALVDDAAVSGTELPERFERTVWARLEPALRPERPTLVGWLVFSPARLGWGALVLLLVAAAFVAGRLSPRAPDDAVQQAAAGQVREAILLMDLVEHLDRSQTMLVELASGGGGAADVSRERERAGQLVAANRLYRRTATVTGDRAIADFLDDLERLLVELSAGPEELSAEQLASLRRRVEAQDLLFKLRALAGAVRERQKTAFGGRDGSRSSL